MIAVPTTFRDGDQIVIRQLISTSDFPNESAFGIFTSIASASTGRRARPPSSMPPMPAAAGERDGELHAYLRLVEFGERPQASR